jgi:hypothetical protein
MSAFSFFRKNQNGSEGPSPNDGQRNDTTVNNESTTRDAPDIPESVFIEYAKQKQKPSVEQEEIKSEVNDLQTLYRYLEQNLEKRGYEDALMNPDSSVMEEQVRYINNELALLVSKVRSYYSGYLRTIDFHIDTRRRSGLIETVDELLSHRETVLEETRIVAAIEEDAKNNTGLSQNLIIGYKRGFRNGFAAITYSSVFSKKN